MELVNVLLRDFIADVATAPDQELGEGHAPTWVANKDFGELELRTSPNFRTSFFVEIANFTELQNFFQQFSKDAAFWKNPEKNWQNLAEI